MVEYNDSFTNLLKKIKWPKLLVFTAFVFSVLSSLSSLLIPFYTGEFVNSIGQNNNIDYNFIILFGLLFIINLVLGGFGIYFLKKLSESIIYSVRSLIWVNVIESNLKFFDDNESGNLISRIINDSQILTDFLSDKLPNLLPSLITLIGSFIILLIMDWKMTLITFVTIPIYLISMILLGNYMKKISIDIQKRTAELSGFLGKIISNIRLVKISNKENKEIDSVHNKLNSLFDLGLKEGKITAFIQPIAGMIMLSSVGILLGYGGTRIFNNTISAGTLVAMVFYVIQMIVPFTNLSSFITDYKKAVGVSSRIEDLLQSPKDRRDYNPNLTVQNGSIKFNNIHFSYGDKPILKDISFEISDGDFVAIVGPSGSGKTTLFNILSRLYKIDKGNIFYNGNSIFNIPLVNWRNKLGYVMQGNMLMNDTIKENLLYSVTNTVEDAHIIKYTQLANCHDFIIDLKEGYHSMVGENGVKLSGGERQRIDIARNFIKNPDVLLLDEATANLDSHSEHIIQETISKISERRTTLVIAHRLSTIKNADKIIFLDKGCITGIGTHTTLMNSHEKYSSFVQSQNIM